MAQILIDLGSRGIRETRGSSSPRPGWFRLATWLWVLLLGFVVGGAAQQDRKIVKKINPEYPLIAKKLNLQGTVKVEITIAPDGSVTSVVTLGGNPVLSQSVEEAVKQWKFASGPEETKKILEFKF